MNSDRFEQALHIVLVEDDAKLRAYLEEALQEKGMVRKWNSFPEPLSFITWLKREGVLPDLVLLDVHFENSGINGVQALPYIKKDQPYLPVILLTGMEGEEISMAQEYECTYYIPKPIQSEHLVKMIYYYLGLSRKTGRRIEALSDELQEHKELLSLLENEGLQGTDSEAVSEDFDSKDSAQNKDKFFQRLYEILNTVLKNCEISDSFKEDMHNLFYSDFKLFKKLVDNIVQFDLKETSSPALNVHKYKGTDNVYTLRISQKVRIFFYQSPKINKRNLLRIDTHHDTKGMEKWLKNNWSSYAKTS
jgi:CheY-like chemotaxis protein